MKLDDDRKAHSVAVLDGVIARLEGSPASETSRQLAERAEELLTRSVSWLRSEPSPAEVDRTLREVLALCSDVEALLG